MCFSKAKTIFNRNIYISPVFNGNNFMRSIMKLNYKIPLFSHFLLVRRLKNFPYINKKYYLVTSIVYSYINCIYWGITLLSNRNWPTSNQIEWTRSITLPVILPNDFISYQLSLLCRCLCLSAPTFHKKTHAAVTQTQRGDTQIHRYKDTLPCPEKPNEPDSCA